MENSEIENLNSRDLIRIVHHELNQKSSLSLSIMEVLLNEKAYGFANEDQKNLMIRLKQELIVIRNLSDTMRAWILKNNQ
jgi:hypothetical protein